MAPTATRPRQMQSLWKLVGAPGGAVQFRTHPMDRLEGVGSSIEIECPLGDGPVSEQALGPRSRPPCPAPTPHSHIATANPLRGKRRLSSLGHRHLRPDGHIVSRNDCLHYHLPGPPDWWSYLLVSSLVDYAAARDTRAAEEPA